MAASDDATHIETTRTARAVPDGDAATKAEGFYRDYAGLRALIVRRIGDADAAADLLQDALVTTLQKLRDGKIDRPEGAGGYVYRVALNHLRNYRRKLKSRVSDPGELERMTDPSCTGAGDVAHGRQWASLVQRILGELSTARDRELLVRFYLDEEEKESICRALGLTEAHFNRVIFRARIRFRELLERKGYHKADLLSLGLVALCLPGLAANEPLAAPAHLQIAGLEHPPGWTRVGDGTGGES